MKNVEDIYPLSPLQEGILFHTLLAAGAGAYVVHLSFRIEGRFNLDAFRRAWRKVVDRHPVLRTSFVWERVGKPLQIVRQNVELPWDERDWSGLPAGEQERLLREYLWEEHRRGFSPAHAPLMRMGLLRLGEDRFQFVWNYSHLLLDGWSANNVFSELSAWYRAYCDGREPEMARPRPYRDFIQWLMQQNGGEAEAFWRKTLKDFSAPTPLGAEDPRVASDAGHAYEHLELSAAFGREATVNLQAAARRHRLTLSTFVEAAWAWLLALYGRTDDVLFGVTVSGRPVSLPGVESMVGVLANTLPLRIRVRGELCLTDWLREIQDHQAEMGSYEYNSLVEIKGWSDVPGALPLFESFVVFENHPVATEARQLHGNVRFASSRAFGGATYPLALRAEPGEDLLLRIIFDPTRFRSATVTGILRQVRTLLEAMVKDPAQKVCELSVLGTEERRQILVEWNQTEKPRLPAMTLQELFEQQAQRTPGAPAVECESVQLTYSELNHQVNQLAHYLRKAGVGPEVRVGICLERSATMLVAVLGVLKAGGAYVPFDPRDPAARLSFVVRDAGLSMLLTQSSLRAVLPDCGAEIVCLDRDWSLISASAAENPAQIAGPQNAAYVIYTSGSTGVPKGVVVQHGSLLNYLWWTRDSVMADGIECLPAITSLGFDASLKQLLSPLLAGRSVVLVGDLVSGPRRLLELLSVKGRAALNCVPSLWQQVLEVMESDASTVPGNLVRLLLGGEDFSPELIARSLRLLPDLQISNLYGPTEATANATCAAKITPENPSIGRPIANTAVYVLDRYLAPVPVGAVGDLYIGGEGLARGYLGHPELTAEKFIPSLFGVKAGDRLYRTGDLARWNAEGNLEFRGRDDQQVKIRGYRIEPGEIESALLTHPRVEQAVVVARKDPAGENILVAYVVADSESPVAIEQLRSHLEQRLPRYMTPAAYVLLPRLPLTAGGKIDRQSLPEPRRSTTNHRPPRTPREEILCEIFAEVLGQESVGIDDDFFDLGGHSLLAMRLAGRIRAILGMELALSEIFNGPTVAHLAGRLSQAESARPPLVHGARSGPLPLSYAQRRLWFIDQLEGASPEYNVSEALRLQGPLDCEAVSRAINGIVERHEILRTCFLRLEGEPVQVVLPELRIDVPMEDLTGLDERARQERIDALWHDRHQAFDLARGPLLRVRLLRLGAQEHILLRTVHHIVWDGWSAGVFNQEFVTLYEAFQGREGEAFAGTLQPLPVQYADFALWQRTWLDDDALTLQLNYWRENLAGIPEQLELPVDRPRGPHRTYAADLCQVTVTRESLAALRRLTHSAHASLYMSLLAVFGVVLERHSGRPDVVIGSPIVNRPDPQLEQLIGFFVNFLIMRVNVDSRQNFLQLLGLVRRRALEAYRSEDLPFERLVEELAPRRRLNTTPIFQVVFALQNAPVGQAQLKGLRVEPVMAGELRVRHDLEVHAREQDGQLDLYWLYNRDLFDRRRMEQMAARYVRLLEAIVAAPEAPLHRLEMLEAVERRQLLEDFNATARLLPEVTVPALFEEQAAATPEAEAVVCGGRSLSYRELNAHADHLARRIAGVGAGPETLVGVAVERSLEMIVAVLGILKAGAAYLPLADDLPARRRNELIADARVRHVITTGATGATYQPLVGHVITIDLSTAVEGSRAERHSSASMPSSAAYVNYTSGSTGMPKGVVIPHAAIIRLVWKAGFARLDRSTRLLQMAPLSFDAATFEIWGALLNGGCLVVMPPGPVSAREIGEALARHRVNVLWLTAGLFHEVVDSAPSALAGITQLLAGGDVLSVEHVRRLQDAYPACRIVNGYGPTENTTFSCCYSVPHPAEMRHGVPIGSPVWNTQAYVLDSALRLSPIGVTGELYVAGAGLARGYLRQPAMTAERFVADPYGPEPGTRMYRTGDLVRWNPQGVLEFVGRADRQVKVRGFRIELPEIEAVLAQVAGISRCAVLAWQEGSEEKRLVAYVVPHAGESPAPAALGRALAERLPGYMVPADFVVLDAFPLTANGKLDRQALPRPGRRIAGAYRAPRTPIEELLCDIFAEVLREPQVGIDDSFFDLGGHSLMATRLAGRIGNMLGVEVALRAIFESPSVAELVTRLPRAGRSRPPLTPQLRPERLPLSYAQQRLWFIDQLEKTSVQYNVPAALRIRGELDPAAVEYAMNAIVRRHESLRTRFVEVEGQAAQVIDRELKIDVPLRDLSGQDEQSRQERVREALRQEREHPFHLARGPLLRAKLLRLGPGEHILLLTFHHIIVDGWSLGVFNREFIALYEAFQEAGGAGQDPLGPLPVQYADFALWQRSWLGPAEIAGELEYWRGQLAGIPEILALPQDRPRQARQTFAAEVCSRILPAEKTSALKQLAQTANATLYMTLLSGLAVLLERYSGQRDIVVGSPIANRQEAQLENLIGFFVNSLVMRAQVDPQESFPELLARVRLTALEAYQHQDLPFERLVEELAPRRSLNTPPVFQVLFALQNTPMEAQRLRGCEAEPLSFHEFRVRLDVELHAREHQGQLEFHWVYNRDLFDRGRIEQMARHYDRLLEAFLLPGRRPLWQIDALTGEERQQILVEWNRTELDVPGQCVHEFFERQAEVTPHAWAVIGKTESLTYGELNRLSNRVARFLRKLGVGPESKVGICMERTPQMPAALLGVMKAGGAYVPLDPKYPAERLAYMLRDSEASVLLVDSRQSIELADWRGVVVDLDNRREEIAQEDSSNPLPSATSGNLAYVIYTSGSTGEPKGVAIRHSSAAALLHWAPEVFPPEDLAGVLASTSICFDLSIFEIFVPLSYGGAVVIAENALDWRDHEGPVPVTLINTVPSVIREMVRARAVPASVRTINLAGEALPGELVYDIYESTGVRRVFNLYGPSEDTTYSTFACLPRGPANWLVPIGRPVANTRAYVLNDWMEPVPVGVSGELFLAGDGLARGYLNRSAMTAERFIPDPFASREGERMYRTGDFVRYMRDGNLEFLGRADRQVKVRGFRIEMGEIEAALARQPEVREVVVIVREDRPGDRRLVAYVVPAPGSSVDFDELRRRLRQTLPEVMVPAALVPLDALPLTPNRKVDRKALPAPEQPAEAQNPVPPRTELERIIARIWVEVLEVESVGVHDNFFDRGGHSILAKLVQSRLHTGFGCEVELVHLFQFPTVASLAHFLEGSHEQVTGPRGGQERVAMQKEAAGRLKRVRGI